ncbi:MAG: mannose-1-phosphate guanylyltransferase/mannose-6-phosphate isomerase [Desulfobacterales bacterium]|nr:mannose-1-phosphate guanylyltransferase/mannose-6-phosphate isomerase [Desulfobacterales bacterium]
MIIPVILAGGSGTRLWPLSRRLYPKQMLKLTNNRTMLQNTLLRINGVKDMAPPMVICNEKHRLIVAEQLKGIGVLPSAIFLEPVGRNTAPAVAVASLKAASIDPGALIMILPADHLINDVAKFHQAIGAGADYAAAGSLITFGVIPDKPETGYGYIRKGAPAPVSEGNGGGGDGAGFYIDEFVEKPDLETARGYLASGDYCWNSGMFMFAAGAVMAEMKRFAPEIVNACEAAFQKGRADGDAFRLDEAEFGACPSDSIDYAVMERTGRGVMIPFEAGWDDLGSWAAIWAVGEKDGDENVISGDVLVSDVDHSLIFSSQRLVAGVGLSRQVVVETSDAVLVASMEKAQAVKHIVDHLKESGRREAVRHPWIYLPWGRAEIVDPNDELYVRKLMISPKRRIAFSGHGHGNLSWIFIAGGGWLSIDDEKREVGPPDMLCIDADADVCLENPYSTDLIVLEVIRKAAPDADHLTQGGEPR